MKKALSVMLALTMILSGALSAFATHIGGEEITYDFADGLSDGEAYIREPGVSDVRYKGKIFEGMFVIQLDSERKQVDIDDSIELTELNGLPCIIGDKNNLFHCYYAAAKPSAGGATFLSVIVGNPYPAGKRSINAAPNLYKQESGSETIGATSDVNSFSFGSYKETELHLMIDKNKKVKAVVLCGRGDDPKYTPTWDELWPKNDEELNAYLLEKLTNLGGEVVGDTEGGFTFETEPNFNSDGGSGTKGSRRRHSILYLPLTASAGEHGKITPAGEKLFRPGDINETYTITADEGYVIDTVKVDGKYIANHHTACEEFTFKAIYGPRSIEVSFRKA